MTLAGSYTASDDKVAIEWQMPAYSDLERKACKAGLHLLSRKIVVRGWVNYFDQVYRAYCACGRRCWVKYGGSWMPAMDDEPDGHRLWIEMQEAHR